MTLKLPQTSLEAIPLKDVGRAAFLAKADALCQIFGFDSNDFSPWVLWI